MSKTRHIKIEYLYRDTGNYKIYGSKYFTNKQNIPLKKIEKAIRTALIDQLYFTPEKWGFERLYFESFSPEMDHEWHEMESISEGSQNEESKEDVEVLLKRVKE